MNDQHPKQQAINKSTTCEKWLLFSIEIYGVQINHLEQIIAIPDRLQVNRDILKLTTELREFGWHTQVGIL